MAEDETPWRASRLRLWLWRGRSHSPSSIRVVKLRLPRREDCDTPHGEREGVDAMARGAAAAGDHRRAWLRLDTTGLDGENAKALPMLAKLTARDTALTRMILTMVVEATNYR